MTTTNSTDATRGQGLRARVETRRRELDAAMRALPAGPARRDLERAIGTLEGLLTGDLDHIPSVVSAQLSQWLEVHKHLAEPTAGPAAARPAPAAEPAARAAPNELD